MLDMRGRMLLNTALSPGASCLWVHGGHLPHVPANMHSARMDSSSSHREHRKSLLPQVPSVCCSGHSREKGN